MSEEEKTSIPKRTLGDIAYDIVKAAVSGIPLAGGPAVELFALALAPPLSERRDAWFESLSKRLRALEVKLDLLADDPAFVSTVLQATQIALRNHQESKLEALRNAVVKSARGGAPEEDRRALFLKFIDDFTPTHLRILRLFQNRGSFDSPSLQQLTSQKEVTDQIVLELARSGLLEDPRPLAAINRNYPEALVTLNWTLSKLGTQFIEFISSSA